MCSHSFHFGNVITFLKWRNLQCREQEMSLTFSLTVDITTTAYAPVPASVPALATGIATATVRE